MMNRRDSNLSNASYVSEVEMATDEVCEMTASQSSLSNLLTSHSRDLG